MKLQHVRRVAAIAGCGSIRASNRQGAADVVPQPALARSRRWPAAWATISITVHATDKIAGVFDRHGLTPPRLALRGQSALTLMTCLLHSDPLALAPVQWREFPVTRGALTAIAVVEAPVAPQIVVVPCADLPLTLAATRFLDLMRPGFDKAGAVGRPRIA